MTARSCSICDTRMARASCPHCDRPCHIGGDCARCHTGRVYDGTGPGPKLPPVTRP